MRQRDVVRRLSGAESAAETSKEHMALKQYEEEYVASLEAEVRTLQKERHYLQAKVQELLAELERTSSTSQPTVAH